MKSMACMATAALVVSICLLQGLCTSATSFVKREPFQSWKAPAGQSQKEKRRTPRSLVKPAGSARMLEEKRHNNMLP